MSRIKRGGYLIEFWMGDHKPKHVHIYKNGVPVAKVENPSMTILKGKLNKKLRKIIAELIDKGKI
jgi:hypothetical protein